MEVEVHQSHFCLFNLQYFTAWCQQFIKPSHITEAELLYPKVRKQLRPADQALPTAAPPVCNNIALGRRSCSIMDQQRLCTLFSTFTITAAAFPLIGSLMKYRDDLIRSFDMTCVKRPYYSNWFHNILMLSQMIYPSAQIIQRQRWLCIIYNCPKVSIFIAVLLRADKRCSCLTLLMGGWNC